MAKIEPKKVAIDSGLLIARITGDRPEHEPGMASLFHEVDSRKVKLFGSTLLFPEILGGRYDDPVDALKENAIFGILDNPSVITMVQVTRQVAVLARELRRELRLKTADATHLASAVFADVDVFMTIDETDFNIGTTVRGVEIALPGSALGEDVLPTTN